MLDRSSDEPSLFVCGLKLVVELLQTAEEELPKTWRELPINDERELLVGFGVLGKRAPSGAVQSSGRVISALVVSAL